MDQESYRRTRAREPVAQAFIDRQDRLLAGEWFAQDRGVKAGGSKIGLARPDRNRRQTNPDSVEKAAAGIIGQKQFADRFLGPVARQRREQEGVTDLFGQWLAEDRNGRGENDLWTPSPLLAFKTDRLEQRPRAVHVDAIALFEIGFGLARNDRGKMEDEIGP